MRIAQVAPLFEAVPPLAYGGVERVVAYLTEELVGLGHHLTLYASGDSVTAGELRACCERGLRTDPRCSDHLPHVLAMLRRVWAEAHEFDFVHFHTGYEHLLLSGRSATPSLTTAHDRMDLIDLTGLFRSCRSAAFVSISNAQREPMPWLNWVRTIYHGLPPDLYRGNDAPEGYLAFVGRLSREKGLEAAVEIARRIGLPLKVAAKIGAEDREYFEQIARKMLERPGVEYVGEIGDGDKQELLGNAVATLFPIDWPEPFGLVMIESMACGTPVVAFRRGSVPEVIDHGTTGMVVDTVDQAVDAVEHAAGLSRARCREVFEERFTTRRMAEEYLNVYATLTEGRPLPRHPSGTANGALAPRAERSA